MKNPIRSVGAAAILLLLSGCGDDPSGAASASRSEKRQAIRDGDSARSTPMTAGFVIENSAVLPIRSATLGREYEIFVKTPPGYNRPENKGRRYPVIYLTDGPYTFQVASGLSRVPFSQERFREFIIVGLSWAKGEAPAESRERDLTPWRTADGGDGAGGAPGYWAFLRDEAMPLVEGKYRVDASHRTLAGQSYGALFGLWVALTEPEHFQNYILTSPSAWFADHKIFETEASYAAQRNDLKARIYLAIGSREHPGAGGCPGCKRDMVGDQDRLARTLRARGYPNLQLRAEVIEDSYHETTFPIGLMKGMQWLYLK